MLIFGYLSSPSLILFYIKLTWYFKRVVVRNVGALTPMSVKPFFFTTASDGGSQLFISKDDKVATKTMINSIDGGFPTLPYEYDRWEFFLSFFFIPPPKPLLKINRAQPCSSIELLMATLATFQLARVAMRRVIWVDVRWICGGDSSTLFEGAARCSNWGKLTVAHSFFLAIFLHSSRW